jgi:hypothetical protein
VAFESAFSSKTSIEQNSDFSVSVSENERKVLRLGRSPIRGNKFSHLSLEDFKETGDETFAWESFEKKLSAYSFLKYLVQENDIESAVSSKTSIEQNLDFSVSVSENERKVLRPGRSTCISFSCTKYFRKL